MVKQLASYVLIVVLYGLGLASIQTLASHPADRAFDGAARRLDEGSEQAGDDHSGSRQVDFRARAAKDRAAAEAQAVTDDWQKLRQEIGKKNCLIFLTATWCVPCKRMHKVIDTMTDDYYVYEIDIDERHQVAAALKVSSVPTMIVMDGGKEVARFTGITPKEKLTAKLKTKKQQEKSNPIYDFR